MYFPDVDMRTQGEWPMRNGSIFPLSAAELQRRTGVHITCPKCGGRNVVFRKRPRSWWCRRCGQEWGESAPATPAKQPKAR